MIDAKLYTLLVLEKTRNFTRAAEELNLTQPAVSQQIHALEKEFSTKIFKLDKKKLTLTPEGSVLIKYAKRLLAVYNNAKQAVLDCQKQAYHINIGITHTVGENLMPQVMAIYCNEHPNTHIKIYTDSIKKLYERLTLYELDLAVVDGILPSQNFPSILLDTDYLCLVVSPKHPYARRQSVFLEELKQERMILRSSSAGTRILFENCLQNHMESIKNFNIIMELDNITMIKDLVSLNLGVSIIARSACMQEIRDGKLIVIPIQNASMLREIHLVYQKDFSHDDILDDFKRIYNSLY